MAMFCISYFSMYSNEKKIVFRMHIIPVRLVFEIYACSARTKNLISLNEVLLFKLVSSFHASMVQLSRIKPKFSENIYSHYTILTKPPPTTTTLLADCSSCTTFAADMSAMTVHTGPSNNTEPRERVIHQS